MRLLARACNPAPGNFGEMAVSVGALVALVLLMVALENRRGAARPPHGGGPVGEDGDPPPPPGPAPSNLPRCP